MLLRTQVGIPSSNKKGSGGGGSINKMIEKGVSGIVIVRYAK